MQQFKCATLKPFARLQPCRAKRPELCRFSENNMRHKVTSHSTLSRQQQEIATQVEQPRQAGIGEAREAIQSILDENGFTLDEVFPRRRRSSGVPASPGRRSTSRWTSR